MIFGWPSDYFNVKLSYLFVNIVNRWKLIANCDCVDSKRKRLNDSWPKTVTHSKHFKRVHYIHFNSIGRFHHFCGMYNIFLLSSVGWECTVSCVGMFISTTVYIYMSVRLPHCADNSQCVYLVDCFSD